PVRHPTARHAPTASHSARSVIDNASAIVLWHAASLVLRPTGIAPWGCPKTCATGRDTYFSTRAARSPATTDWAEVHTLETRRWRDEAARPTSFDRADMH